MREEENKRSSQSSSVKRFFKKRWVFPAIYIASAALILTAVLWYQSSNSATDKYDYKSTDIAGKKNQEPAIEVSKTLEDFKMPVENADAAVVKTKFYDFNGKTEDQEAALVFYNNTYQPNTGIDVTMKDDESFNVVAALSGTVTRVDEDAVLGNVIEVEHDKGIVTQYQSVKDIKIKVGEEVKQGQVLATAGQSLFNEKAGTHVHFEIRKDGIAVNPTNYFNKSLSTLQEAELSNDKASESVETPQMKEEQQKIEDPANSSDQETNVDEESSTSTKNANS
ncbi:M23 family metallopeptidase [Bacillus sp. ISL-40]|uniref:M23 family metallopeptidase n=1 Tax=unclassified Bacillus (in: firmicutes) TaxID=185979 RepID=UPI001BE6F6E1|nr:MULTISPECIES: M23 family metallopeptidase [unclassified Bacillus (in: firmicutes)]MBT2699726.1 M23 family metallopeptidase [Bacillus sp. ISL-40]MBT2723643.1 M23 family metallopeptidase [Bacillus sp. ISL-46]MBT2739525.1 M23 family metallopeptidase [Bacillus sp. ISL-77]